MKIQYYYQSCAWVFMTQDPKTLSVQGLPCEFKSSLMMPVG